MTRNENATTDDESGGCPECGGEVYREPNIKYGTKHETTSGHACMDCSWYALDDSATTKPPALRTVDKLEDELCDACGYGTYVATYVPEQIDDKDHDNPHFPAIICRACGTIIISEPDPYVYNEFDGE